MCEFYYVYGSFLGFRLVFGFSFYKIYIVLDLYWVLVFINRWFWCLRLEFFFYYGKYNFDFQNLLSLLGLVNNRLEWRLLEGYFFFQGFFGVRVCYVCFYSVGIEFFRS